MVFEVTSQTILIRGDQTLENLKNIIYCLADLIEQNEAGSMFVIEEAIFIEKNDPSSCM